MPQQQAAELEPSIQLVPINLDRQVRPLPWWMRVVKLVRRLFHSVKLKLERKSA